jgi:ATP-dependent phosphofructokinase / diphosphate-dependent phosphofructokinase
MHKRIGILTGGGDAPGLNAVLRGVVKSLAQHGLEVWGIQDGFEGLVHSRGHVLTHDDVSGIIARGGTILGTTNRGEAPEKMDRCYEVYKRWGLDGIITVGGDGTHKIAHQFMKKGGKVVGVPKTIDNDVAATELTFGFDTAVSVATHALEALHSTADAHGRIMVVEVMGRTAGWIALYAGVAGGADVIILPELGYDIDRIAEFVRQRHKTRRFTIVVVAEGATSASFVAKELSKLTGVESRVTVLGHLQRAGGPTPFDRVLGTRYGCAAADLVMKKGWGRMVALKGGQITSVPIAQVAGRVRLVPRSHELIRAALAVGTHLGH